MATIPYITLIINTSIVTKAFPKPWKQTLVNVNEQSLVNVSEQIYKSIDKGKISLLFLLDLSKAFGSVNHDLFLNKLVQLNIDSTWFASYYYYY